MIQLLTSRSWAIDVPTFLRSIIDFANELRLHVCEKIILNQENRIRFRFFPIFFNSFNRETHSSFIAAKSHL